jgi:hypothetical protein
MSVTRMAVRSGELSPSSTSGTGEAIHTSPCSASTPVTTHQTLRGRRVSTARRDERPASNDAWRTKARSGELRETGDKGRRGGC